MRIEEILALCEPIPETGCMIWMGRTTDKGYALVTYKGQKGVRLHRLVFAMASRVALESIPDGMTVRHACDVRCCVSPYHLSLGTQHENVQDSIQRGRHAVAFSRINGRMLCRRGHDLSMVGYTTRARPSGYLCRSCRQCKRERAITYREAKTGVTRNA